MSIIKTKIEAGKSFVIPIQLVDKAYPIYMIWIEAGTFYMGSHDNEPNRVPQDEKQFQLTITQGFWIAKHPTTVAQWYTFHKNQIEFEESNVNLPVTNVNWYEALALIWELNRDVHDMLPEDYHFSLPTEGMWEYACRADSQEAYFWGASDSELDNHAWYRDNSLHKVQQVGEKKPNKWGLHDMLGNISEWCLDAPSYYPDESIKDLIGYKNFLVKNLRGGNWASLKNDNRLRCAGRDWLDPIMYDETIGFRIVLHPRKWTLLALSNA